jgi:hypothetical protein
VVVAVSAPVLKEPVVPVPPPPEEVHEVLLVDDQLIVVLAPFAMEVEAAEMDMVGGGVTGEATVIVMP